MRRLPMPFPLSPLALTALLICFPGCGLLSPEPEPEKFTREASRTIGLSSYTVLNVENFAGDVTIDYHESKTIVVKSVRWAENEADLDRLTVEAAGTDSGYHVRTDNPDDLDGVGVDLDITAPRLSRVYLRVGVGNAIVHNPGTERTNIHVDVGNIDTYCPFDGVYLFEVGIGNISLVIPSPPIYAEIALSTGIGKIEMDHFRVDGEVTEQSVTGTIGSIDDSINACLNIKAAVGVGNIELRCSFAAAG